MPFVTRRLLAAATALGVLALVLGGVMRERCLMDPGTCCPPATLALVDASPSASCMAPGGPDIARAEAASRWQESTPNVFVSVAAFVTLERDADARSFSNPVSFRSDQVPLTPQARVLRI